MRMHIHFYIHTDYTQKKFQQKFSKYFIYNINRINNYFPWSKNVLITIFLTVRSSIPKTLTNKSWGKRSRIFALEIWDIEDKRKVITMKNVYQNMNRYLDNLSSTYFTETKSNSQQGLLIVKRHNPFNFFFLSELYFSIGVQPQTAINLWFRCSHRLLQLCLYLSDCIILTLVSIYIIMLLFPIDAEWRCFERRPQRNFFCFYIVTLWI